MRLQRTHVARAIDEVVPQRLVSIGRPWAPKNCGIAKETFPPEFKNVGEKVPLQKSTTSVHRADAEALNIVVFICLL
jgi:hypothetical protein